MAWTVKTSGPAAADLARIAKQAKQPKPLLMVMGTEATEATRDHYRKMQSTRPNKQGWRRQNFWAQVARSVFTHPPGKTSVRVGNSHEAIAQKVYGGVISPKTAKFLTIPLREAAYGKRAEELDTELRAKSGGKRRLFVVKSRRGNLLLASSVGNRLEPAYLLRSSVTQRPDPEALPESSQLQERVLVAAKDYVEDHMLNR